MATLSQSENNYLLPLNNLVTELEKENVSCITTITFSIDNFKEQLKALKVKREYELHIAAVELSRF